MNRQMRSLENANKEQRPQQHVRPRRRAQHYMGLHGKDNAPEPPAITPAVSSPASSSSSSYNTPPNPTPPPQRPSSSGQAFSNTFNSNSSPTSDGDENSDGHYESDHVVIEPSEAQAETHPQHDGANPTNDQPSPSSTGGEMTTTTSPLPDKRLDHNIRPAWTSYSLFQNNLNRFDMDKLHGSTHYLTSTLTGRTWLDANGDGKRGDYADATLNEMEYTMGIDGVHVQLVNCETDEPVMEAISTSSNNDNNPSNNNNSNNPASSVNSSAGTYTFNFQNISSGRYYFMYTAPKDYRISGNVLPLQRNFPYFDCIPRGGEGDIYIKEARQRGDWDVTGYCARSIGCFEVDHKINPHSKSNFDQFTKLETLQNDKDEFQLGMETKDYTQRMGSMAALPTYDYMNVGLAIEKWELPAYQYADFLLTLEFPMGVDLQEAVPEDFGRSPLRKQLEEGFNEFLRRGNDNVFSVKGVDLHRGEVMSAAFIHKKSNVEDEEVEEIERRWDEDRVPIVIERNGKKVRRKRMLRGLSERYSGSELQAGVLVNQLTYTLTARGSYRPPPYRQLGQAIQEAINSDSQGFVKELKDKEALPEVFHTVEDVKATHLTVAEPKKTIAVPQAVEEPSFFEEYGLFIGIAVGILAILICISCICRRELIKRRRSRTSAGSSDDDVKQVNKMKVRAIKAELESYGIPTERILEKKTLVDALVTARRIGMVPIHDAPVQAGTPMQSKSSPGGNSYDTSKTFNNSSTNFNNSSSNFSQSHASDGWKPASILRKNPTPVKQRGKRIKFSLTTFRNSFSSSEATPPTPKTKASGRPRTAGPAGPGRFNPYATNAPSASSDKSGRAQHSNPIFNGKLRATIRDRRIQEATKNLEHLKIGELRGMLIALGIDSSSFVEKSEFVRALAAARVDGVKEKNVGAFPTSSSSPSSRKSKSKAEKKRSQSYTTQANKMGYSFTRERQSRRSRSYTKGTERKPSYGTDPLDDLFDDDFSLGSLSPTSPSSPPTQPVDPPHQQRRTSSRSKTRSRSPHPAHKSHSRSHSRDPPSPHQRQRTGSSSKPRSGSSSRPRTGSSSKPRTGSSSKSRTGSSSKPRSGSSSKPRTGSSTRQSSRPRAGSSSRQRTPDAKGRSSSNPRHSSSSHDHKKYQQRSSYHSAPNQDRSSSPYGSHHRPRSSSPYHRAHGKDEARPRSSSPYSKQDSIRSDLEAADKFNKSEPWMF